MLLIGLLTAEVTGGSEVIAAAEGTSVGDCFPDGGDDTDELSGLRESEKEMSIFFYIVKLQSGVQKSTYGWTNQNSIWLHNRHFTFLVFSPSLMFWLHQTDYAKKVVVTV